MLKLGPCFKNFTLTKTGIIDSTLLSLCLFFILATLLKVYITFLWLFRKKPNTFHHYLTNYSKRIHAVTVYLLLPFLTSSISYSKLETSTSLFAKDETVVLESNETREHFKLKKIMLKGIIENYLFKKIIL